MNSDTDLTPDISNRGSGIRDRLSCLCLSKICDVLRCETSAVGQKWDVLSYRKELQSALCGYAAETLTYIDTVRRFCQRSSRWILGRESELEMMLDIKDRADQIDLKFNHVTKSENKGKALGEYLKSLMTQGSADSRREELEKELSAVLKDTLQSLQELDGFLEAVEMLAVTSLHVFMEENPVLHLPAGISLQDVQVVVIAARRVCPLLLNFKRDADNFFLPRLHNVEVLSYQLDKYIKTTQTICEKMEKR